MKRFAYGLLFGLATAAAGMAEASTVSGSSSVVVPGAPDVASPFSIDVPTPVGGFGIFFEATDGMPPVFSVAVDLGFVNDDDPDNPFDDARTVFRADGSTFAFSASTLLATLDVTLDSDDMFGDRVLVTVAFDGSVTSLFDTANNGADATITIADVSDPTTPIPLPAAGLLLLSALGLAALGLRGRAAA